MSEKPEACLPPIIEPRRREVRMPKPLLNLGKVANNPKKTDRRNFSIL
jgi:hypothetical protein